MCAGQWGRAHRLTGLRDNSGSCSDSTEKSVKKRLEMGTLPLELFSRAAGSCKAVPVPSCSGVPVTGSSPGTSFPLWCSQECLGCDTYSNLGSLKVGSVLGVRGAKPLQSVTALGT